jgi:hypothetical protein
MEANMFQTVDLKNVQEPTIIVIKIGKNCRARTITTEGNKTIVSSFGVHLTNSGHPYKDEFVAVFHTVSASVGVIKIDATKDKSGKKFTSTPKLFEIHAPPGCII